jgi:hypothetical protein
MNETVTRLLGSLGVARFRAERETLPVLAQGRFTPNPLQGQALHRLATRQGSPTRLRVLLDRSQDSAEVGEPTQDFLVVDSDPRRLCFAVTDGVGGSFMGDLAAQMLANGLVDWLMALQLPETEAALRIALDQFLMEFRHDAADRVAAWPIPASVTGIVREALEQKRDYGSEAMFVCVGVDYTRWRPRVFAAWLGDTRLRMVLRRGRAEDIGGDTADRWSSRLGTRGNVGCRIWRAGAVRRVIACSDGVLPELESVVHLPDALLADRLTELSSRANSDDVALVDVAVRARAMPPEHVTRGSS